MNRWLKSATQAWTFIETQRAIDTAGWKRDADDLGAQAPVHHFYHGTAGIILFLLELAKATDRDDLLARAVEAGEDLVGWLAAQPWLPVSLTGGWAGHMFVLDCLYEATGDGRFRDAAVGCVQKICEQAQPLGTGVGWVEPIPYSDITGITGEREMVDLSIGGGGAILALLHAARRGLDSKALDVARAGVERLIEVGERTPRGLKWTMMTPMPFPFDAPNFSHGSAGIGFVLAEAYRSTGEQSYLDAAIEGALYAASCETPRQNGGSLICHLEHVHPPEFYLGVCHGPPGTGRLFALLAEITGEGRWKTYIRRLMQGLLTTGAPQKRSAGLWQNYGQCCGDAGIGDFALYLARTGIWDEGLDLADDCARSILAAAECRDGGLSWLQAEHRARPDFLERQTGYMQGAAGIGSFLVHIGTYVDGKPVGLWQLDWPHAAGTNPTESALPLQWERAS